MDVIAHVDSLPASIHEPGGCLPIDGPGMEELLSSLPAQSTRRSPGGSASNVARGVAELLSRLASGHGPSAGSPPSEDIRVQFIGMVGDDETAAEYEAALVRRGVAPRLLRAGGGAGAAAKGGGEDRGDCEEGGGGGEGGAGGGGASAPSPSPPLPTATCLCLVTPGGQRTMRTCLGAASLLKTERQLPAGWSEGAAAVHVEGYALWREGLAAGAMEAAAAAAAPAPSSASSSSPAAPAPAVITSIDCASFEVVRARRGELEALLATGRVDVLFCNEEEAAALAEGGAEGGSAGGDEEGDGDEGSPVVSRALRRALGLGARVAVASLGPAGARAMAKRRRRRDSGGEEKGGAEEKGDDHFSFCSYWCPAEVVESVEDTVGAGDAFAAGFLTSLLLSGNSSSSSSKSGGSRGSGAEEGEQLSLLERGEVLEAALRLGCAAGAAAVRASGADPGKQAWDAVAAKVHKERERERELALA